MRVLVACEFSGVVRRAFRAKGHEAYSCDLLPADDDNRHHYQRDVLDILGDHWDLIIAHPPCTYLCSSGLHWNKRVPGRTQKTEDAIKFVEAIWAANSPRICIENPIGCLSTRWLKPSQIIQPWMFGHPESKATCLWLKGLPTLAPTNILEKPASGRWANQTASGQNKIGPSKDRWKLRSVTYEGIAKCMAETWG